MSETPHSPGDAEPTQRFDPAAPPPAAAGQPAPSSPSWSTGGEPSPADPTQPVYSTPTAPEYPSYDAGSAQPYAAQPYAAPTSGAAGYQQPTSGAAGYQQAGYPQAGYQQPAAAAGDYQQAGYQQPYQQQQAYQQPYPQQGNYPVAAYQQAPPQYDAQGRPLSDKSKVVAGILGIALGGFGAGRFYTGHTGIAVAQLIVTIFTCGLGHFWGLIDGIMILVNGGTDAQGRVLRD